VNVPIGIVALVIAFSSIPETVTRSRKTRRLFDFPGAILIFLSAGIFIYGVSFGAEKGWFSATTLSAFIIAAVLACLTIAWERMTPSPVLDLSILKDRRIATGISAIALSGVALSGTLFLIPLDLDLLKGYSPGFTGLLLGAGSLLIVISAPVAGTLSDRIGSKILCISAGVILLVSLAVFAFCDETVSLTLIILSIVLRSIAVGLFMSPNLRQVMACCEERHAGALSGLYAFFKSLGATLGIVLMETIFDLEVRSQGSLEAGGAVHLALPIQDTLAAFHSAFFVGMLFCIGMIVLSTMMQERKRQKYHSGWNLTGLFNQDIPAPDTEKASA
jgi:MFS family permease